MASVGLINLIAAYLAFFLTFFLVKLTKLGHKQLAEGSSLRHLLVQMLTVKATFMLRERSRISKFVITDNFLHRSMSTFLCSRDIVAQLPNSMNFSLFVLSDTLQRRETRLLTVRHNS